MRHNVRHNVRHNAAGGIGSKYVQISRKDLEKWLDKIGHRNWKLAKGRAGIYLLPLSDVVAVKISSTIGSRDEAKGYASASMKLALVSLVSGRVLNKKAQGQGHFKRTINWEKTWAKGIDRMIKAYKGSVDFYDAIAAIEDRDRYKSEMIQRIEGVTGWGSASDLTRLHTKISKGGVLMPYDTRTLQEYESKGVPEEQQEEDIEEDPMVVVLRKLWSLAKEDRDKWTMDFAKSLGQQLLKGRSLSRKQKELLDKKLYYYRLDK